MPEDKKTGNPLIDREYVENYKLTIEAPQSSVERYYFWILNFLKSNKPFGMGLNVEKMIKEINACFIEFKDWDGKKKISRKENLTPKLEYN